MESKKALSNIKYNSMHILKLDMQTRLKTVHLEGRHREESAKLNDDLTAKVIF